MGIADQYKSLRTPSSTWAREVAGRVHKFYGDVLENLQDIHEDWFVEIDFERPLGIDLHRYTLEELAKARAYLNHPTLQLHEFVVTQEPSEFARTFFEWYERGGAKDSWRLVQKNISDIDVFEGDHYIATVLTRRHPDWLRLSDEDFDAAWEDAREEALKEYRVHARPRWDLTLSS